VECIENGSKRILEKMVRENLESEVNHPDREMVQCKYLRCKKRGEQVNCYFAFEQCNTYQRWKAALDIYTKRALQRQYLKDILKARRKNEGS